MMKTAIIRMDTSRDGKPACNLFTYGKIGMENGSCVLEFEGEKILSDIGDHVKFYFQSDSHVRLSANNADDALIFDFRRGPVVECISDGKMINVHVTTHSVRSTVNENGGELDLSYTMAYHHMLASKNEIHLVVQAVNE